MYAYFKYFNKKFAIFLVVISVNIKVSASDSSHNKTINNGCANNYTLSNFTQIKPRICASGVCIQSCCENGKFYYQVNKGLSCKTNKEINNLLKNKSIHIDTSILGIYDRNYNRDIVKTKKNLHTHFNLLYNEKFRPSRCRGVSSVDENTDEHRYYLLEDGTLVKDIINKYQRFTQFASEDFCVGLRVRNDGGKITIGAIYKTYYDINNHVDIPSTYTLLLTAMSISITFLALTIIVNAIIYRYTNQRTPNYRSCTDYRRKIKTWVMMTYVVMLIIMFTGKLAQLVALQKNSITSHQCKSLTLFLYFIVLSSFFWMNILSFDIWRNNVKSYTMTRRQAQRRFLRYGAYAWGVPGLVTIVPAVMDYIDLSHKPYIIKPFFDNCFFKSRGIQELTFYLYVPIGIVLILNCIFFVLSAISIFLITRNLKVIQSRENKHKYEKNKQTFLVYMRLFLLMGISWCLEVFELPDWLNTAGSAYNGLMGLLIFLVLVVKRETFVSLCDALSVSGSFVDQMRRKSSVTTSTTPLRTQTSLMEQNMTDSLSQIPQGKRNLSIISKA